MGQVMGQGQAVCDGFNMNAALRFLPDRYFPLSLGQLDSLRGNPSYRARWYNVPEDPQTVIDPLGTFTYDLAVGGGSWFWGLNFASVAVGVGEWYVQIGDSCTGSEWFSSAIFGAGLRPSGNTRLFPVIFEPRLIVAPGHIHVEITNRDTAVARQAQLLLHFAEPCDVISD